MNEMHYTADELNEIKGDLWRVLNALPNEVPFLRDAIVNGKIQGDLYIDCDSEMGCLIGTMGLAKGCSIAQIDNWPIHAIVPVLGVYVDPECPIEMFVKNIFPTRQPDPSKEFYSPYSAQLLTWVDEWLAEQAAQHEDDLTCPVCNGTGLDIEGDGCLECDAEGYLYWLPGVPYRS